MKNVTKWWGRATLRANHRRARLGMEQLETRLCPAKGFEISEFSAEALPNHVAKLTGYVLDIEPESVKLFFTGGVNGTTSPNEEGEFSFTTPDAHLGMVYAYGINSLDMEA